MPELTQGLQREVKCPNSTQPQLSPWVIPACSQEVTDPLSLPIYFLPHHHQCSQLREEQAASPLGLLLSQPSVLPDFGLSLNLGETGGGELKAGKPPAPFLIPCPMQ